MTSQSRQQRGADPSRALIGRLDGTIQSYAWGSRTLLARLQGRAVPTAAPEAELWFGTHPAGPAWLQRPGEPPQRLDEVVAADPATHLGAATHLPYLVKILAVAAPLSVQVHPDADQARRGFEREEAAAIASEDPRRNYRDPYGKPELVIALGEFEALAGFRDIAALASLAERIGTLRWRRWIAPVVAGGPDAYRSLVADLLHRPRADVDALIEDLVAAASRAGEPHDGIAADLAVLAKIAGRHPHDPGVIVAALFHRHVLEPGQALMVEPGCPHAYLQGFAVEIMAPSDNVLRAGLTAKPIDVDGFVDLLRTNASPLTTTALPYRGHFAVASMTMTGDLTSPPVDLQPRGPEIVLVTAGVITVTGHGQRPVEIRAGAAAWVPAAVDAYHLTGEGAAVRVQAADLRGS